MTGRKGLACALALAVAGLIIIGAAIAQGVAKSSEELLEEAFGLYNAKEYEAAIGLLEKINLDDLGKRDKSKANKYLARATKDLKQSNLAKEALQAGKEAISRRKYSAAVEDLKKAVKSRYLNDELHAEAVELLAKAEEGKKESLARAKALLKTADAQVRSGQLNEAQVSLDEIRELDAPLGWFGRMKLDSVTKKLSKRVAAVAAAELKKEEEGGVELTDAQLVQQQADLAKAEALTRQGQDALQRSEWRQARNLFRQALEATPTYKAAQEGLKEAEGLLGTAGRPLLPEVVGLREIERQRVYTRLEELYAGAGKKFSQKKYELAKDLMAEAELRIRIARVLSPEEAEDWREKFHTLRKEVEAEESTVLEEKHKLQAEEAHLAKLKREEEDSKAREEKIKQLWIKVRALRNTMQFEETIRVLDRLLEVDPTDERAKRWREDLQWLVAQARKVRIRERRRSGAAEALVDVNEAALAHGKLLKGRETYMRYLPTKEWKDLVALHEKFLKKEAGLAGGESPAIAAMRAKLQQRINIDMAHQLPLDRFLHDVVKEKYRETTGAILNIMIDEDPIKEAKGVEDISEVFASPVQLEGVTVERVLQLALPPEVSFDVRSDLILITTRERLQENLPARTYAVRDLTASIPEFGGQAPSFDITSVIETGPGTGGGGGGGAGFFEEAGGGIEDEEEVGVDALKELIMRTVNPRSDTSVAEWLDNGGTATIEDIRGVLVITQTKKGHQLIGELLDQLRSQRAVMVSVETRYVTVSDDFLQDITLDVDLAFQGGRRWDPAGNAISDPGGAAPYTTLPGLAAGQFGQPIVISSTSSNGAGTSSMLPLTSFGFTGNEGGIAIAGVFLDKIQLGFMLRAIQADKRSTVMWAPRITMYDGQRAYVSVTTQNLYVSDLEPVVSTGDGDAGALYDPTISAIPEGTTLDVRATVSADRKYVQLDLYPQVVGIAGWEDFSLGVEGTLPISLPQVTNQEIRTTVSVPDGGTLLLGGLKKFTEIDVEAGAPILNKIPILKRLFNNRASLSSQSNLLILITPRIIVQAEEEHEQTGL